MFNQLITDVKSLNLPTGSYALFGSAPIIVRGIREASHDIDIVVKQSVWDEYKGKPEWVTKPMDDSDEYLEWDGHNIELWRTWGPGEWDLEEIIGSAEIIDGLQYVKLETVLAWKQRNGRPKDVKDIELITNYLRK
ncbi:hypothetical protein EPO04_03430 [Patescibacteria group bacterium]|nr:MAG: hypothetical protein EPO04_03430 [Patescibacteria group bacterium]